MGKVASCSFAIGNYGYIVGGETYGPNQNYADTWEYNHLNDTWIQKESYLGNGVHFAAGFVIDDVAFVGGGGYGYRNDFFKYAESTITSTNKIINREITIYPNPSKTNINIELKNYDIKNKYIAYIVNSVGQTVMTMPILNMNSHIDISELPSDGIYFLQLIDSQNNILGNQKFLIE